MIIGGHCKLHNSSVFEGGIERGNNEGVWLQASRERIHNLYTNIHKKKIASH